MRRRKLAAIMFTDIEGYTAIMQRSEDEALAYRKKHRNVFREKTGKYNGEILQYYGDGTLSIFDSAVDAVQCGVEIQHAMQDVPKIPLRIGIHLGDIIISDEEIIGNGVNVASRIESLSVAGGILISDKVYDEVRNSASVQTQFMKRFKLKNVEEPVSVYAISNPGVVVPDAKIITGKIEAEKRFLKSAKKLMIPSLVALLLIAVTGFWVGSQWGNILNRKPNIKVAVLPLDDTSSGEGEEYLPDAMTDELTDELSRIKGLTVLSQSTSKVLLAGVGPSNNLIDNQLSGIDYFVTGSISQDSGYLKAEIFLKKQLDSDKSIWRESYTSALSQARNLWSDVAMGISKQIGIKPTSAEIAQRANIQSVDPESYALYLKGKSFLNQYTPENMQKGIALMEEALDKDPTDAHAYAHLAEAYVFTGHAPDSPPDVFSKALSAARRAIQLDSTVATGWAALAHYHTYFGRDWELAEYAYERANALNPNMAYNHYHRAWYLVLFGRMNEAIVEHKRAQELEPFEPVHTAWLGELYHMVGLYDEALDEEEKAAEMVDGYSLSTFIKGITYLDQGKSDEALETLQASGWKYFGYAPALARLGMIDEAQAMIKELEAKPRNPWWAYCLGVIYSQLGNQDKAFEWLDQAKEDAWYPWIRVEWVTEETREDPRFLELMEEMHLPPPAPLQFDPEAL